MRRHYIDDLEMTVATIVAAHCSMRFAGSAEVVE